MQDFKRTICPRGRERESQLVRDQKGFFDAIDRIAKLEVLNDIGGGRIREVLEVAAETSNSFRTGNSAIGSLGRAVFDTVDNGAFALLGEMGLGEGVRNTINAFQPQAVNLAVGTARTLSQDIQRGRFTLSDIPNRVQDFQNLEQLVTGIFVPSSELSANALTTDRLCRPSPFAVDLVNSYGPKQNFSFFVEIRLNSAFIEDTTFVEAGETLSFMVKSTNRPQINYEYEDVNYYNFRTKVIQRQMYQPITMRFMDDTHNNAARFHALYSQSMSPLNNLITQPEALDFLEENGMNFNRGGNHLPDPERGSMNTAGIGPLHPSGGIYNTKNIIKSISIYHIGSSGNTITSYNMFNPKITSLQPSELTMEESGNGAEFSFDFDYDALFINPDQPIGDFGTERVRSLTGDALAGGVGAEFPLFPIVNGTVNEDGSVTTSRDGPEPSEVTTSATSFPQAVGTSTFNNPQFDQFDRDNGPPPFASLVR